ncbi:unnamed protein product, partial [Ectocarpus fasciculatus]
AAAGGEDSYSSSSSGRARPPPPPRPLGQLSWTLRNDNGTIAVPATVPGHVHLDLLAAGVLDEGDPYFGTNELAYSWVALTEWTYVLTLPRECWGVDASRDSEGGAAKENSGGCVDSGGGGGGGGGGIGGGGCVGRGRRASTHEGGEASASLAAAVGLLTFEGIDTFATIRVNGREVGSRWSNQFMPATFVLRGGMLSELLTKQVSTIEVALRPALVEARQRAAASRKTVPDSVFFGDWAEPAHRNFARKAGADFGWDWGPAFVPAGLPGSVSLTVTSTGRLLPDVAVAQDWGSSATAQHDSVVEMTVTAFLDGFEEPGRRRGGKGGGVFVADGEGIDDDDDVPGPSPPASPPSSDDLRRGAGTTPVAAAAREPGAGSESLGAAIAAGVAVRDGADGTSDAVDAGAGVVARVGVGVSRGNSGAAAVAPQSSVHRATGLRKVELVRVPIAAAAMAGAAAGNGRGGNVLRSAGTVAGAVVENARGEDVVRSAGTAAGAAAAGAAVFEGEGKNVIRGAGAAA